MADHSPTQRFSQDEISASIVRPAMHKLFAALSLVLDEVPAGTIRSATLARMTRRENELLEACVVADRKVAELRKKVVDLRTEVAALKAMYEPPLTVDEMRAADDLAHANYTRGGKWIDVFDAAIRQVRERRIAAAASTPAEGSDT